MIYFYSSIIIQSGRSVLLPNAIAMVTLMDLIVPWILSPNNLNAVVKATHVDCIVNNVVLLITSIHGNRMVVHRGCGMVLPHAKVCG